MDLSDKAAPYQFWRLRICHDLLLYETMLNNTTPVLRQSTIDVRRLATHED